MTLMARKIIIRCWLVIALLITLTFLQTTHGLGIKDKSESSRGFKRVSIKDRKGQEVGLYKESHALVIGVSKYTSGWPRLPGVKKDIKAEPELSPVALRDEVRTRRS